MGLTAYSYAQVSDNFSINQSDLIIQQNGIFDEIKIIDSNFTDEIGNPQLPVKTVSYVLPYNSTVTEITINSVAIQKLSETYYILPAQHTIFLDWSEPPPFVEPNPEIYNSNAPYPNKAVEIINDGYTHGYHVVTVAIYPVVYHPANREIFLREMKIFS